MGIARFADFHGWSLELNQLYNKNIRNVTSMQSLASLISISNFVCILMQSNMNLKRDPLIRTSLLPALHIAAFCFDKSSPYISAMHLTKATETY